MRNNIISLFIRSAGLLLLLTAIAKFISASGSSRILQVPDPIITISYGHIFWIVGTIEFVIAVICLCGKQAGLQLSLVAWLSTVFLIYRIGLLWIGYQQPCKCLGNLTDALHIPESLANQTMQVILFYLLLGSYVLLFFYYTRKNSCNVKDKCD